MTSLAQTPRTTPRRHPERATHDFDAIASVLDEALVAHVGFMQDGAPVVMPTVSWRMDDHLYFHFGAHSRFAKVLAGGAEVCVTVTLLDGLVLARSAFHHSVNFRSVMLFGVAELVEDEVHKRRSLDALVDHVVAGRSAVVRAPDAKELDLTAVLRLPITEGTLKTRSGPPVDRPDDLALPVSAGIIGLTTVRGELE